MEEIRTKGIVIDAQDYKEYDKILTILTYDRGVIKAVIKGVKKSTAKQRFAGQVFCFLDIILSKKGSYYTIISCDLIESFFEIAYKYDSFLLAVDIVKIIKYISKYNPDSSEIFVIFLSILNVLHKTDTNNNVVYIKFLTMTLKKLGFEHNYIDCDKCHQPIREKGYIDSRSGRLLCHNCNGKFIDSIEENHLKIINNIIMTDYVHLSDINIEDEVLINILRNIQTLFKLNCG